MLLADPCQKGWNLARGLARDTIRTPARCYHHESAVHGATVPMMSQ